MTSSQASSAPGTRAAGDVKAANQQGPPLVLLAAGLGSRFGGVKPLAPVGHDGEPLLAIALEQAADAGFIDVVVVVGGQTHQPIVDALTRWPTDVAVQFASQDGIGPARDKPWGTVGALLAASRARSSAVGYVLANGDDLYGAAALRQARHWLLGSSPADGAIIGYEVARTLSSSGGVSRAVPVLDAGGRVVSMAEGREVRQTADGIRTAAGMLLAPETPVSMNLFALRPSITSALGDLFVSFLDANAADAKAELGLPDAIGRLLRDRRASVDLIVTRSQWHGVTWPDDVERVRSDLIAQRSAHRDG